jgi:hypothetical protein
MVPDLSLAEGWLTDKMILMASGEWLVYRSQSIMGWLFLVGLAVLFYWPI